MGVGILTIKDPESDEEREELIKQIEMAIRTSQARGAFGDLLFDVRRYLTQGGVRTVVIGSDAAGKIADVARVWTIDREGPLRDLAEQIYWACRLLSGDWRSASLSCPRSPETPSRA